MIRVAIVEDEEFYAAKLQQFLAQYGEENNVQFNVTVFSDGSEITARYRADYDLLLLDIQMKLMDGLTAAEHIRKTDENVPIIFVSQMAQFAIRGYSVGALDFVLKPVSYIDFSQKLRRALDVVKRNEKKYISLAVKGGVIRFDLVDIYYIESLKHYMVIHTESEDVTYIDTMKNIENRLAGEPFYRCNNCYLVNLAHVKSVRGSLVQVGGFNLQISRPRKKDFMRALTDYLGSSLL